MAKLTRASSRYSRDAAVLLGQLIRVARIGGKLTHEQLAERAGISRGLVHRIEKGTEAARLAPCSKLLPSSACAFLTLVNRP